ncbi:MAG: gliding motility-associated C-terminal domain-containing protein, partial [Bacteroidota bacterium]
TGLFNSPCWNSEIIPDTSTAIQAIATQFGNESISELPFQTSQFFYEPTEMSLSSLSCREDCPEEEEENCTAPFLLQFDEGDAVTFGGFTSVARVGDDFYVGGRFNGSAYVAALRANGSIDWQYQFTDFGMGHIVTDLLIDDEGMLVGIGRATTDFTPETISFAFRINPIDGSWLWRRYTSPLARLDFRNIFQPNANGDFLITGGQLQPIIGMGEGRGIALRLDRETGNTVGDIEGFSTILNPGFIDATLSEDNSTLYVLGTAGNSPGSAQAAIVFAINVATLQIEWSRRVTEVGTVSNLRANSLTFLQDKLYVLTQEGPPDNLRPILLKFSSDGTLENSHLFEYGTPLVPTQVETNGNQLIFGADLMSSYLLQFVDPVALIPELNAAFDFRSSIAPFAQSIRMERERILLATSLRGIGGVLAGYDLNLQSSRSCQGPFDGRGVEITALDLRASPTQATGASLNQGEIFSESSDFRLAILFPIPTDCELDCMLEEICDNQLDDDGDGLIDCDDPDLANDCCCQEQPRLDLGADTLFCPGQNVLRVTGPFVSYRWSDLSTADTLLTREPGTYWVVATDSCQNTATDTITLHPRTRPLLDLGPDTVLCSNAIIPRLAQDGFASYEWVDGTTEKGFTAYEGGVYWVIATDSCGGVQRDTVNVRIDPVTEIELGVDTTICPGDTLSFRLSGFTRYQWSQSSFIDCFDCSEVRFFPDVDTVLVVAGDLGPGCISADSIRVRVAPVEGRRDTMSICVGDTISFGSQRLFQTGQYYDNQTVNNCSFTDTLDLFQLPVSESRDTLRICEGTAVPIFGRFESEPGEYSQLFTAANGCDSTAFVELEVVQALQTFDTLRICAGDSVAIFGQFEGLAGSYQMTFTSSGGCDSTHQIQLEADIFTISTQQLESDCEGAAAGAGEVIISGLAGAASIQWNTGATTSTITDLAAGTYFVTVTTTSGCTRSDSLLITATQAPELSLFPAPESCMGRADGSLAITGDVEGLLFSIDGGTTFTASPIFEDLLPGDYNLIVANEAGCDQERPFTIEPGANIFLLLPPDQTITLGDSVVLVPTTNAPDGGNLHWLASTGESCIACPTFTVRPTETVTVYATTLGECPAVDSTEIRIIERLVRPFYVPNAFSPNGDGVNEVFRIFPGPGVEEILSFAVYDRWGGQVFLAENVDPASELAAWDGRLENSQDPGVGVYIYVVAVRMLDGSVEQKAGDVTILR